MKKQIFKLLIFLLASQNLIYSQHILKDQEDVKWYKSIHQERIFVHHNTSLLFTGEYLYYKLYCINSSSNNLSKTSKIGYVELIGENGTVVFRHKINLENGLGQGDFFVPTSIPSGNYKLLAYTQWMRNGVGNNFFSSDISIINPYKGNQSEVLESMDEQSGSLNVQQIKGSYQTNTPENNEKDGIAIRLLSKSYNNRSKVIVDIIGLKGVHSFGNYSISVRKVDTIQIQQAPTSSSYNEIFRNNESQDKSINDEIFMPEFKGEMITGRVINSKTKKPSISKDVAISIADNESVLDITTTNENGVFFFHLSSGYNGDNAIFQVIDDNPKNYEIELNAHQPIVYTNLKFNQFKINAKMKDLILERSINNQIQNGFFGVKPDTIKSIAPDVPFFGNHQDVYNLDDYVRFPTVNETVIEIIEHAWTRKNEKGQRELVVRGREFDPYFGSKLPPLVMVDGIFIQNHENILAYKTSKVERISVLRDEYYYGSVVYKGVISIKTFKGEFSKEFNDPYLEKAQLFKPRAKKNYFNQSYEESSSFESSRIPDFRQQLIWIPDFELDESKKAIEFFTSDLNGIYEISLEGFTNQGIPVSVVEEIQIN
jgi:hypothetical protein